jgi:hypothetical protein
MFEMLKTKQIWANFQRSIELFTQKIVIKLSKYGFGIRDPRSGIYGSKRHRLPDPDPDPQHCFRVSKVQYMPVAMPTHDQPHRKPMKIKKSSTLRRR